MAKRKIRYEDLYSYDEKRGMYYTSRVIGGTLKKFRAKDAETLHEKVEAALEAGPHVPTFREVAEEWKDAKWPTIQKNTQACYLASYNRAVKEFGDRLITDIQPAEIQRVILRLRDQGFSAKTVKTQKCVTKMIFSSAIVHDPPYILANPADYVTIPRGLPKTKRSAPEDDVVQKIIDNVDTAYFGLYPYLLLYTGCRRGEALALTWGDIDFDAGLIRIDKECIYPAGMPEIKTTKTEAGVREVPLLPGLRARLEARLTNDLSEPVFPAPDGRYLQERAFRRRWLHYCKDVGLVRDEAEIVRRADGTARTVHHWKATVTPHQIRHGYSTILYEAGVDAKTAQQLLGHADINTTLQIYTDIRQRHKETQVQKLTDYMGQYEKSGA